MISEQVQSVTVTADGTAFTGAGDFVGCSVSGTVESTTLIYDNTSAAGTIICAAARPGIMLPGGMVRRFATGLHVDLTTAGHVTVYFIPRGA
nr:hypothetical protein WG33_0364 [uncultured bacterium]